MEKSSEYFYVIVRTDLTLADQICQVAHACVEAGKQFGIPEHCNLVLLSVPDRASLLAVAEKLERNRVDKFVNFEPDDDLRETALATCAVTGSTRRLFSSMPLWKAPGYASVA